MFGQLLSNKNKMLQYYTVLCSNSAHAESGELNTDQMKEGVNGGRCSD
jgi:hypothetical protein